MEESTSKRRRIDDDAGQHDSFENRGLPIQRQENQVSNGNFFVNPPATAASSDPSIALLGVDGSAKNGLAQANAVNQLQQMLGGAGSGAGFGGEALLGGGDAVNDSLRSYMQLLANSKGPTAGNVPAQNSILNPAVPAASTAITDLQEQLRQLNESATAPTPAAVQQPINDGMIFLGMDANGAPISVPAAFAKTLVTAPAPAPEPTPIAQAAPNLQNPLLSNLFTGSSLNMTNALGNLVNPHMQLFPQLAATGNQFQNNAAAQSLLLSLGSTAGASGGGFQVDPTALLAAQQGIVNHPSLAGNVNPLLTGHNPILSTDQVLSAPNVPASNSAQQTSAAGPTPAPSTSVAQSEITATTPSNGEQGRTALLYIPCDDDELSDYQCLIRKQIEVFEAQAEDVQSNAQGRNKPIKLGQVGIRCKHCASCAPRNRLRGATYYPAKLNGLYQAAQNMASSHIVGNCEKIPSNLKQLLRNLKDRKSPAGGGKQYWADGAKVLGIHDNDGVLRFAKKVPSEETEE